MIEQNKRYLIKTKSFYYVGELSENPNVGNFISFKNVTLIGNTGDYHNFINRKEHYNSNQSEVTYFNYPKDKIVYLNISNIIEIVEYDIQFN